MGDMGEMYREWNEDKKKKKRGNLERSLAILNEKGIRYESRNGGVHVMIKTDKGRIDFWPSTGLYVKLDKSRGRGIFGLLKYVKMINKGEA